LAKGCGIAIASLASYGLVAVSLITVTYATVEGEPMIHQFKQW